MHVGLDRGREAESPLCYGFERIVKTVLPTCGFGLEGAGALQHEGLGALVGLFQQERQPWGASTRRASATRSWAP